MVTLFKALVAQLLGLTLITILAWLLPALFHGVARLLLLQGIAAASCGYLLRQPTWWIPIHLLFLPTAITLLTLQLPPWFYLVIVLLLVLIFWSTVQGDVPLFLSSTAVAEAIVDVVEQRSIKRFVDLGAGTGTVVIPLAQRYPMMAIDAFEHAPLPWFISVWYCRKLSNVKVLRTSFWNSSLSEYDVAFAFLSPAVMAKLGEKIGREMRLGSLFISSSFPIPDWQPESVISVDDRRKTMLFCYRIGLSTITHPLQ
ncbi:MAG: hypothetical protein Q8N96_00780 [Methylovulum sp.]|nr:hypothetical protein [Methylovulum sp.]